MVSQDCELRNGRHVVVDPDFLEAQIMETGAFTSTGLADEPPLPTVANDLADALDDALSELAELELAEQQRPWTLEEAQSFLDENASAFALGLSENAVGYTGINIPSYKGVLRNCMIRVIPRAGATPEQIANPIQFEGSDWKATAMRCMSALFPNPQAA